MAQQGALGARIDLTALTRIPDNITQRVQVPPEDGFWGVKRGLRTTEVLGPSG